MNDIMNDAAEYDYSGQGNIDGVFCRFGFNVSNPKSLVCDELRYILVPAPITVHPIGFPFTDAESAAIGRQAGCIIFHCEDSGFVDISWYSTDADLFAAWHDIEQALAD